MRGKRGSSWNGPEPVFAIMIIIVIILYIYSYTPKGAHNSRGNGP